MGARVYGRMPLKKIGTFVKYAAVDHNVIAKVPEYLSDEEAASVPLTALTALQAFELMNVKSGKYDKMAVKNKQKYYFVFVREDGVGLERISEIYGKRKIETSVDKIFELSEINEALAKVAGGGSKGKTILKIS